MISRPSSRSLLVALIWFIISHMCFGLQAGTTVVLDPGHGGRDGGTNWAGVAEKTLTLKISRLVQRRLSAAGVRSVLTRRSDVYRSLNARAAVANSFRNAVFVSIHCNAETTATVRGIETFYYRRSALARSIHRRLDRRTDSPNRGVKNKGFTVLARSHCPAALVECGFLSSRSERRLLLSPLYQECIAKAIADGITSAIGAQRSRSYALRD